MIKKFNFKKLLTLFSLATVMTANGQVGINTTSPNSTLDVVAKNTDGSTAEGLIAPRLTGDQIKAADTKYSANQTGVIVYATSPVNEPSNATKNITSAGYYYFNGSIWKNFSVESEAEILKTISSIQTGSYTALPTDDLIRFDVNTEGNILTLPTSNMPIGKIIYVSNKGKKGVGLSPLPVNTAFTSVGALSSGILVYLGGGEWDWLTGY